MKRFSFPNLLIFALSASIALTGCKHPQQPVTMIPNATPTEISPPPPNTFDPGTARNNRPRIDAPPPIKNDADLSNPATDLATNKANADTIKQGGNVPLSGDPMDWPKDANVFKAYTVYFAFDSSTVKDPEKSKVQAVADYFKDPKNSANHLIIEGHCDERGTEGYNLALGDRRALALRDQLIGLGVGADKIHTVSYGLSRPAELGHNEAAWSKNRRGVFILASPNAAQ